MSSRAQRRAKRENAQRSPTAVEEIRESPTAKPGAAALYTTTVLPIEDQAAYNRMLHSLLAEATLGTTQEAMLIQVQAQCFWKMQRAANIETGAFSTALIAAQIQLRLEKPKNEKELGEQLAYVLWEQAKVLDKVRRYASAAERGFFRATKELAQLRKAGHQEQIGYVPQNAHAAVEPTTNPSPEIGYDSRSEFLAQPETMSEDEEIALFGQLTADG